MLATCQPAIGLSFKYAFRLSLFELILKSVDKIILLPAENHPQFKFDEAVTTYDAFYTIAKAWNIVPYRGHQWLV